MSLGSYQITHAKGPRVLHMRWAVTNLNLKKKWSKNPLAYTPIGAVTNVSTASGTNQIHGELHFWERNSAFDAPNFFNNKPEFQQHNLLPVDPEEAYAANSVWINETVLTPAGFPKTRALIESAGYEVRPVDVPEFQKLDGGLSCLSLRF